jgi:hypothetical protein
MYQSETFIKRIKEISDDVYWQTLETPAKQKIQDLKIAKKYDKTIQELNMKYLEDLYSIIGSKNLRQYQTLHRKRMEKMRIATLECPATNEGYKELEQIRRKIVEKSLDVIKKSNIKKSKIKKLQKAYKRKANNIFMTTIGKGKNIREDTSRIKNTDYEPPFSGWAWAYSWNWSKSGGLPNPEFSRYLDHNIGLVGSHSYLHLIDADDSDYAEVLYRTAVRQWYRMPKLGQVKVKVEVERIETPYWGGIEDECGWSEIDLRQHMKLFAQVTIPTVTPRIYLSSSANIDYHDTNESSHSWSRTGGYAGTTSSSGYYTIPGPFNTGTWVVVDVGVETRNNFSTNDCTVKSGITQKYLIRKIGITTT